MEGIELVAVLVIAWCLGYWSAHIRLTAKRRKVLGLLIEARDILTRMGSDREKTTKLLDKATALTDKASVLLAEMEADRSRDGRCLDSSDELPKDPS